ncbi:unnamed protein product, partial [Mesorhabditis belari]|uniref:Uncharacterized protein n=1 Tax=Mesorhabditis belari TaxID=2138241 RepID=A0AAF3F345_9BILA
MFPFLLSPNSAPSHLLCAWLVNIFGCAFASIRRLPFSPVIRYFIIVDCLSRVASMTAPVLVNYCVIFGNKDQEWLCHLTANLTFIRSPYYFQYFNDITNVVQMGE